MLQFTCLNKHKQSRGSGLQPQQNKVLNLNSHVTQAEALCRLQV